MAYFYEDFLAVYDNKLRKQTGSYYTPPEVVGAMVGLVDEVLRSPRFGQHAGMAASSVTIADRRPVQGHFCSASSGKSLKRLRPTRAKAQSRALLTQR